MKDNFDALWRDLARFIPTDMRGAGEEFQRNFRDFLSATLRQMNLVTREEYEVQTKLLRRLEQQVCDLEKQVSGESGSPDQGSSPEDGPGG